MTRMTTERDETESRPYHLPLTSRVRTYDVLNLTIYTCSNSLDDSGNLSIGYVACHIECEIDDYGVVVIVEALWFYSHILHLFYIILLAASVAIYDLILTHCFAAIFSTVYPHYSVLTISQVVTRICFLKKLFLYRFVG